MGKLSRLEPIVKEILEEYPMTREDDMCLYWKYIEKMNYINRMNDDIPSMCICSSSDYEELFTNKEFRKIHKISPYHSVARCRRKLQATYEELKPSEKVQDARLNETSDYIDYAIDGYNTSFMKMVDSYE